MNKTYKPTITSKKQKRRDILIRSSGFQKRFQEGMPRINKRAVPFHNVYDVEISNRKIAQEQGYKFWGCITKEKRRQSRGDSEETQRRNVKTRGQTMLTKYMKRRPSLALTARQGERQKVVEEKKDKKFETISNFKIYKNQQKSLETTIPRNENESLEKDSESFMITMKEFSNFGNKSLYQMSPQELEVSILWKKKFLQYFKRKFDTIQVPDREREYRSIHY